MFKTLARIVFAILAAALGSEAAFADGFTLKKPAKIGILYYTLRNDGGWTQAFDEARLKVEAATGQKIQFVEGIPDDASIKPAAEKLIQRGVNVIIGTSFGYSDTFKELAKAHPDVAFLNASGTTNGDNLESFYGRTYESQYLCGMAAGAASKTGKLGFVAAFPIGVVNWTVNAFALGAQQMKPGATVTVVYTGSWDDSIKDRAATTALIDQGADVIGQHVNSPTPQIVAQERGKVGTGHHRDMRQFAPKATVCSSVWVWDKFLAPELKKIQAGGWKPNPYGAFIPISAGGTDIACCGPAVSKADAARIMAERSAVMKGKQIYAGPLADETGKERVPAGGVLSDADLWKMDWYVKGVISQK